ncbi:MAG TPA: NADH-quinone oxidoreductase subunit N [Gemmatimonadaceae bacterium]|nr:NADH-quinone oxidoreductase subunit N [Gemmatimonadaceae bacterium]
MTLDLSVPSQLITAFAPDMLLMGGAMILLLWAAWRPESEALQRNIGVASIVLCVTVIVTIAFYMARGDSSGPGVIAVDNFRWTADIVFLIATIATIALSMDYNAREGIAPAESHVLLLFATSGMMTLAAARDLMIVFLGIEIMSVAVYVLAGLNRRSERSAEGALKYFLLGAFSTGFLLYGIALVYGATGTTNLTLIGERVGQAGIGGSAMLIIGIALLLIGFGFKVALAPFHMWAPDVYEGAPTPITAYMAAAVKAAAFASFLRVWIEAFSTVSDGWHGPVWWLAVATMVLGNIVALAQKNIKRMLAYSSIAHAGYILVAVATGTAAASGAFMFYLLAYTLATMGAFGVIVAMERRDQQSVIEDYAGLWSVRPWLATAMAVFMLALLGFPIFGGIGFFAKYWIIQSALQAPAPQTILAVILVLTSVVSAGYYLYVVMVMFMRPRNEDAAVVAPIGNWTRFVIAASAVVILALGILPNTVVRWTQRSTTAPPVATTPVVGAPAASIIR